MKVNDVQYRSVWFDNNNNELMIIDQTLLPFEFKIIPLKTLEEVINSIKSMQVRGAPAIGIAAAYAAYFATRECKGNLDYFNELINQLIAVRPTAVNLKKGAMYVANGVNHAYNFSTGSKTTRDTAAVNTALNTTAIDIALNTTAANTTLDTTAITIALYKANEFAENEIRNCEKIGIIGVEIIKNLYEEKRRTINILTHCNAGWLACGDWGTATAPIYKAHRLGIPLHIWIDETRPLNQGSRLTAWEMYNEGIDFSIITDNAGGMLMQNGNVDLVITGADRIAQNGDTANKVGTYLKALAAMENKVPFYIAAPSSTIDINTENGDLIIIEERNPKEVSHIIGLTSKDKLEEVRIVPDNYKIYNLAFDITPHNLITGIITEKGIFKTDELVDQFS